ncbi:MULTISPECIES: phosphomannomutase/phosphoglucomutase [unclassified Nitratiruptor]|uniref:phosphomannomutase/phosphoglucomutase n=1 Tax=unclassified Nitratiruptor TaxID=2624044 RepID=UPI0019157601|nr:MULTISPECIES: phosphomannomutase/phosphoglucomutase [unclassified Nitratiruptor]BCD60735.1 phosphomannomutase / phosphoglucomutase [Nitratiruptor sp. YY08-10]BCD64667.1 phosphomannomutase / phosphoglucomutase [Nitratiruptor sp. YY08-14]
MKSIFREYDIRGIFQKELNVDIVKKIGYFLAQEIKGEYIAVGYDARLSSPTLFSWLASGINKAGKKVLGMGMVPTGVNYFSNFTSFEIEGKKVTPSASVMITGSHNPPEYNGFKITVDKKPFFAKQIKELGQKVLSSDISIEDNDAYYAIPAKEQYIDFMLKEFDHLKGFDQKIALDCGNGVAGIVLEPILNALEFDYFGLYCEPDGTFPNHHPDPSEEKNLKDLKKALKYADIGFAYDGDADRIAVLTKKHNFKGDELAIIFARYMENPIVIGEVKCSQVMYDEINKRGRAIMYKTGHSNLKEKIAEVGADFAAEVSGHLFFNDRYFGYDDAIYATFRVIELIHQGTDLDKEIESLPRVYNTPEIKVGTTEECKFKIIEALKQALQNPPAGFPSIKEIIDVDGLRIVFEDGWALVRASNTTPILVTRFEAKSEEEAKEYEEKVMELVEKIKDKICK